MGQVSIGSVARDSSGNTSRLPSHSAWLIFRYGQQIVEAGLTALRTSHHCARGRDAFDDILIGTETGFFLDLC
jgi:hypothetical protein